MKGYEAPARGMYYFIGTPSLWWRPIFAAIIVVTLMLSLFSFVLYFSWPNSDLTWLKYIGGILTSAGLGFASVLVFWVLFLPGILTLCFQGLVRKVFKSKQVAVVDESLFGSIHSSLYVLMKTLGWRIFWPLFTLIMTIFISPLGVVVGHLGLGHIIALDSVDLALSLIGIKGRERIAFISSYRLELFLFGCSAALFSMLLSFTIIGWFFWLPGMLCAGTLFVAAKRSSNQIS